VSLEQPIASAANTGECRIGAKSSIRAIKMGEAKLVVVAANAPIDVLEDIDYYAKMGNVSTKRFEGTSWDLGEVIGKPFMVAAIAVIEPGDSNILELA
jgi:large subunit ribosomal protein L30e